MATSLPSKVVVRSGSHSAHDGFRRPPTLTWLSRRLRAALAAVLVRDNAPELRLVHHRLDSWSGGFALG
jgi:hypothetical protein